MSQKPKPASLKRIAPLDLAWIAGLLEGEGYFCVLSASRGCGKNETLLVGCGMTDMDVIYKLQRVVGAGHVSIQVGLGKTIYRWKLSNSDACALMTLLLPMMGRRRSVKIRELMAWYERKLAILPTYRIRNIRTGKVETPYELKAWCKSHGIPRFALDDTMRGGRGRREHAYGYVREQ
jgi:hypothetical protein